MSNKIWVLTSSYNDYNQHGDYFIAAFANKPSHEQITKAVECRADDIPYIEHILSGGGRESWEDVWYNLEEKVLE